MPRKKTFNNEKLVYISFRMPFQVDPIPESCANLLAYCGGPCQFLVHTIRSAVSVSGVYAGFSLVLVCECSSNILPNEMQNFALVQVNTKK